MNLVNLFGFLVRARRTQSRFDRCIICKSPFLPPDDRGNRICKGKDGHMFGPDAPRGEIINQGKHHGEI